MDTCVMCGAGKFAGPTGGQIACVNCPIGFYLPVANLGLLGSCLVCNDANGTGMASCPGCEAGKKGNKGSNTCENCPAGQWAGGGNKIECENCPKGWHGRDIVGAQFCDECPVRLQFRFFPSSFSSAFRTLILITDI